jgi:hypothetical protein
MATAVQKKLHELGNGVYAYTQLPGSWGWSNAGLITDGDQSLLVDTLFDEQITAGTRRRYDAGMSMEDTVRDLTLDEFEGWLDAERTYVNLHTLYRDFVGDTEPGDVLALFAGMGRLQRSRR